MPSVEQIRQDIESLSPREQKALADWLAERDADAWDKQIEHDLAAGRLDDVLDQVKADIAAGQATKL